MKGADRKPGGRKPAPFPTVDQIAAFIRESPTPVTKREIARAFRISGDDRARLKALLKDLERDGAVDRGRGRRIAAPSALPAVAIVEVGSAGADEEVIAVPTDWAGEGAPPRIAMLPGGVGSPVLAEGVRVLARLRRLRDGSYEGRAIRALDDRPEHRLVGVFRREESGGRVLPADRRDRDPVRIGRGDEGGAEDGELVVAVIERAQRLGPRRARIVERLGDPASPRTYSLIAIHSAGIRDVFPAAAIKDAEAARPVTMRGRVDLTKTPLVTIDGADARDFDDAVFAEPDPDPTNPGGFHLIVAIADVAHYVPHGSPLDREAFRRGNSVYFPDRVVPMLPEALSNELCSLKPGVRRACLAVHLWIDRYGVKRAHRFERAVMRSAARLTYDQVQASIDGTPDDTTGPLLDGVIRPLYEAFRALADARAERGTLDIDLPERRVVIGADGDVVAIGHRERHDAHKLIEEFMILANVAAAETLEARHLLALFRVHDAPDRARVMALKDVLEPLGYPVALGQVMKPVIFNRILAKAKGRPEAELVSDMVLRTQAQALYSVDNIGHFGLALPRYAHFTSPIRRYADLTVHRGLIRVLGLGSDGSHDDEIARLEAIGQHISSTERIAAEAERDAVDRFVARWLSRHMGQVFRGRIVGVARFGLFVRLDPSGADGLVPISSLPEDFYDFREESQALLGRRWGRVFRLGAPVAARVVEAEGLTGSAVFRLVDADEGADLPGTPALSAAGGRRLTTTKGRSGYSGRGRSGPRK